MRISDWSSDVCSSDLLHRRNERADGPTQQPEGSSVMAILTGLMRLGRDAELKYTAGGDAIANLALAYNYGKKENGKQPSQRSEEHTSELQSLMRISYAVFCLKKKNNKKKHTQQN